MKTCSNYWSRRGCNLPRCAERKTRPDENRLLAKLPMYLSVPFQLTRSLSVELAPPVLYEHGLAVALEWLSAETRKNYNIEVTVEADYSARPESRRCAYFPVQSGARVVAKFGEARWRQRRADHDAASAARQGPHHRRR